MTDQSTNSVDDLVLHALMQRRDARREGERPRAISARAIARAFGICPHSKSWENRRRGVRTVIHRLRKRGEPILSSGDGYFIGTEPEDFEVAEQFARTNGLKHLVLASHVKHAPERGAAGGQMAMFA